VNQDTSPSGVANVASVAEVCDQYLLGLVKSGSLGQVMKKNNRKKAANYTLSRRRGNDKKNGCH